MWTRAIGDHPGAVVRDLVEALQVVVRNRHCPRNVDAHPVRRRTGVDDDNPALLVERLFHLIDGHEALVRRARNLGSAWRRARLERWGLAAWIDDDRLLARRGRQCLGDRWLSERTHVRDDVVDLRVGQATLPGFHRSARTTMRDRPSDERVGRALEEARIREMDGVSPRLRGTVASLAVGGEERRAARGVADGSGRDRHRRGAVPSDPRDDPGDGLVVERSAASGPICRHRGAGAAVSDRAVELLVGGALEEGAVDEGRSVVGPVSGAVGAVTHSA